MAVLPVPPFGVVLGDFILVLYGILVTYIFFMFADYYVTGLQRGLASGKAIGDVLSNSTSLRSFVAFALVSLFALADAADVIVRNKAFPMKWNSRYIIEVMVLGGYFFTFTAFKQETMHFITGFAFVLFWRMLWNLLIIREQDSEGCPVSAAVAKFLLHESVWIGLGVVGFGVLGIAVMILAPRGLAAWDLERLNHFIYAVIVWWTFWTVIQRFYLRDEAAGVSISLIPRIRR